ncbi:MAG TPA: GNAT family N-acetyltransferase [Acidimicrobiales bacterium]|nr:GNAT family N-acetyltransferase [Acidimicrobiales bacterium]
MRGTLTRCGSFWTAPPASEDARPTGRLAMTPGGIDGDEAERSSTKGGTTAFTVTRVQVGETLALRQAVLRPHQTLEEVAFPGDDDPSTVAFAAVDAEGGVLSVARVTLEEAPFPIDGVVPVGTPEWRLRGMATRPDARNQGIGSAVLQTTIAHVASQGGGLLWCNARVPATGLYRRAGFTTYGEEWLDPDIGPHIVMWRLVAAG